MLVFHIVMSMLASIVYAVDHLHDTKLQNNASAANALVPGVTERATHRNSTPPEHIVNKLKARIVLDVNKYCEEQGKEKVCVLHERKSGESEWQLKPHRSLQRLAVDSKVLFANFGAEKSNFTGGALSDWLAFKFKDLILDKIECEQQKSSCMSEMLSCFNQRIWVDISRNRPGSDDSTSTDLKASTLGDVRGTLSEVGLTNQGCTTPFKVRGTFLQEEWVNGWSNEKPGFIFWFRPAVNKCRNQMPKGFLLSAPDVERSPRQGGCQQGARLLYGSGIVGSSQDLPAMYDELVSVSLVHHRYYKENTTLIKDIKDRNFYHSAVLLEWSNEETTIVELAFRNGVGSRDGKVLWYEGGATKSTSSTTATATAIYEMMGVEAPQMIQPWNSGKPEIRMYDLPDVSNLKVLEAYLEKYTAKDKEKGKVHPDEERPTPQFVDPRAITVATITAGDLKARTRRDINEALLRYEDKLGDYVQIASVGSLASNCQTFAADFINWLTGGKTRSTPLPNLPPVASMVFTTTYKPHPEYFNKPTEIRADRISEASA